MDSARYSDRGTGRVNGRYTEHSHEEHHSKKDKSQRDRDGLKKGSIYQQKKKKKNTIIRLSFHHVMTFKCEVSWFHKFLLKKGVAKEAAQDVAVDVEHEEADGTTNIAASMVLKRTKEENPLLQYT
ncbi:uncharacterized protein MKS88_000028 [Plasmodium brasilianum]|uniref:uncharacterized protein n=1 Tax=Plasmodium brasilianum TaxID=5824 RepID=UPI00350E34C4|nr:hypothetical protein MKS88_000028 [Plasmodium brasilianum]